MIVMYGVTGTTMGALGREQVTGAIILRDNIPKITTARLLALRYSKEYGSKYSGKEIYLIKKPFDRPLQFVSVFHDEELRWDPHGSKMERKEENTSPQLKNKQSPIVHHRYSVNGRDGTVKFIESYRNW